MYGGIFFWKNIQTLSLKTKLNKVDIFTVNKQIHSIHTWKGARRILSISTWIKGKKKSFAFILRRVSQATCVMWEVQYPACNQYCTGLCKDRLLFRGFSSSGFASLADLMGKLPLSEPPATQDLGYCSFLTFTCILMNERLAAHVYWPCAWCWDR